MTSGAMRLVGGISRSRVGRFGAVLVAGYALVALAAPWIAPLEPGQVSGLEAAIDFTREKLPPSLTHPFGTGEVGVDLFAAVVWGTRLAFALAGTVVVVAVVVGGLVGGFAGTIGGRVDEVLMRLTDVALSVPILVIAMGVSVALGPSLTNLVFALALVWWPGYARLVRSVTLGVREEAFVEAARALGASTPRVVLRHVLPGAAGPVLVQATLDMGTVVLVSSAISFVGFGPGGPNVAEWGNLVARGQRFLLEGWWGVTFPGLAIFGFALGFNLLGDALRDTLDPHTRGR